MTARDVRDASPAAGRGRSLAVVPALVGAALCVVGSTQTWLTAGIAGADLPVSGAEAVPVLQPLGLAALALSLVLAIVGVVLRYVLAAVAIAVGGAVSVLAWGAATSPSASHVATVVSEHTGVAGEGSIAELVTGISVTPWPVVTVVAGAVIVAAGVWTLLTAHRWRRSGRRYESGGRRRAAGDDRPLDAVDSWDDLSRGDDPTR